jgi:hypothetical protein
MWYYKDGALLVETPVVTGNVSAGNASPEGVFCLVGKEENATLVGEDYQTPVSYWMPFYGGVGIHDADSWRSTYGGEIYLTSGSHGCINTPTSQAAIIYRNIEIGTPIVCYSSGTSYGYDQWSTGTEPTVTDSSQADIVIIREDEAEIPATAGDETEAPITIGDETEASATAGDDAEFPITVEDEIIIY